MARPREFDIDDATDKALEVFWEHGYDGTSLPDLLEGMSLSRGSLYKAFTDKKTLFLRVLARYEAREVHAAIALLTDPACGGWDRITALFASIPAAVAAGDRKGCLLCSAVAGPAHYDADIAATAQNGLDQMRAAFHRALLDAASAAAPPEGLDDLLVTHYVGLRVQARSGTSADRLSRSVAALGVLRPA